MNPPDDIPSIEPQSAGNVLANSVVLSIKRSKLGNTRTVTSDQIEIPLEQQDWVHVSKLLFDCDEYKAICSLDDAASAYLKSRCLPLSYIFKGGTYLLPDTMVLEVDRFLKGYQIRRNMAVNELAKAWPEVIARAETALGPALFQRENYPNADGIKRYFAVSVRIMAFETPTKLQRTAPGVYAEMMAKAETEVKVVADECIALLRSTAAELVNHLAEQLAPGDDGKKKKLTNSAFDKLTEFCGLFEKRNIANDRQLAEVVATLRATMDGLTLGGIKNSEQLKAKLSEDLGVIKTELTGLTTIAQRRKFVVD